MKCFCEAEVSERARFCPYCGRPVAPELTHFATATIGLPNPSSLLARNGSRKGGREILTEATTLKGSDWNPPLPPKFKATLQRGTAPELVMWEMFKRFTVLRILLEETVTSWPAELGNDQVNRAKTFLQSHCASCGEPTHQGENGKTPVCTYCQNK